MILTWMFLISSSMYTAYSIFNFQPFYKCELVAFELFHDFELTKLWAHYVSQVISWGLLYTQQLVLISSVFLTFHGTHHEGFFQTKIFIENKYALLSYRQSWYSLKLMRLFLGNYSNHPLPSLYSHLRMMDRVAISNLHDHTE